MSDSHPSHPIPLGPLPIKPETCKNVIYIDGKVYETDCPVLYGTLDLTTGVFTYGQSITDE